MERACSSNNSGFNHLRNNASKNPAISALQDLLFYQLTGVAFFTKNILQFDRSDDETNNIFSRLIYLTNKNINFSTQVMTNAIYETYKLKVRLENLYRFLCKTKNSKIKKNPLSADLKPGNTLAELVSQANIINIQKTVRNFNLNIYSMKELLRISISSISNYLEIIKNTDKIPISIYSSLYNILNVIGNEYSTINDCKEAIIKSGELQSQTLELLTSAFEKKYGFIERKKVTTSLKKGSAILIVGEDFNFLKKLLEETKDKPINCYTYGVLNYSHVFPEFNKYKNLAGIYIGKYNNFSSDIENFPGVVVLTSGNLEELREIFRGRIFSTEDISMLGVTKIDKNNLKVLINAAYDAPGFDTDKENCYLELGFGIKELENNSEKLSKLLKNKSIQKIHIFVGNNDLSNKNTYIKNFFDNKSAFDVSALITLNCALNYKNIDFPFVLNFGHFVNMYSLIRLLYSVAGNLKKNINDLPLNIVINLRTQDSVSSLFMLMSLGIKNIEINSELPNYQTEAFFNNFSKKFGIEKVILEKNLTENKKFKNM